MSGHTAVGKQWTALLSIGGWEGRFPSAVTVLGYFILLHAFPVAFLLNAVTVPVFAQDAAESETKGLQTPVNDVSFPDQKLTEVADLLSTLGGVNINVAGNVDAKIAVNYSVKTEKTIHQVLDDLASLYKLWIDIGTDGSVTIRPLADKPVKAEDIKEKTFPVRFSRPSEILDLVRQFLSNSPQADAIALDSQKAIVVRDIPEGLARIEEFLNRVDIPKQSTVFPILYGDVQEIADIIKERLPDLEEGALTVDVANSQIIVKTTLDNLTEIQLLIETLDIKKEIRVFTISFHEVEDVVDMLEELNLLSEEGTVVSNEYTGKLIIQDTPERLDRIAEAIKAYDTPRPAVFVEAEIMDVNAAYSFGWNPTLSVGDGVPNETNFGDSTAQTLTDGQQIVKIAGSGAFEFAALDAGTVLARLLTNESDSDARTMASPRLIVERGEEARLTVGSEEPIGVRSYSNSIYNQNDIVTQRVREVGIRLIIEAMNISERGYAELYIGLENSSVPPDGRIDIGGGTTGLRVLTANIETTAVLKDGRTLAVGGLLTRDLSKSSGGTPFLNRAPFIRYFFSNLAKADNKRKLLLFITPHILNLDTPYQKYMNDEETFSKLEGKRELKMGEDVNLAGIEETAEAAFDSPAEPSGDSNVENWVNVEGKWGFYDDSGQFVDRTSEFMSAFSSDAGSNGWEKIPVKPALKRTEGGAAGALRVLDQQAPPGTSPEPASDSTGPPEGPSGLNPQSKGRTGDWSAQTTIVTGRHARSRTRSQDRDAGMAALPRAAAEPVAYRLPPPQKAPPEKKGAWNRVKSLFTLGKGE
jgi:type II secretory pathway component GspD/PulD (secretin)